jgi:hypothetical protein
LDGSLAAAHRFEPFPPSWWRSQEAVLGVIASLSWIDQAIVEHMLIMFNPSRANFQYKVAFGSSDSEMVEDHGGETKRGE